MLTLRLGGLPHRRTMKLLFFVLICFAGTCLFAQSSSLESRLPSSIKPIKYCGVFASTVTTTPFDVPSCEYTSWLVSYYVGPFVLTHYDIGTFTAYGVCSELFTNCSGDYDSTDIANPSINVTTAEISSTQTQVTVAVTAWYEDWFDCDCTDYYWEGEECYPDAEGEENEPITNAYFYIVNSCVSPDVSPN